MACTDGKKPLQTIQTAIWSGLFRCGFLFKPSQTADKAKPANQFANKAKPPQTNS